MVKEGEKDVLGQDICHPHDILWQSMINKRRNICISSEENCI